jgi:hypothetical protein
VSRLKHTAIVVVVVFTAAQFVRPQRTNPPIDASRTIQAHVSTASGLGAILDRACGDCHSNQTTWPWYSQVAPLSWLMSYGVAKGRRAINFSEWGAYPPEQQQLLLVASCRDVSAGRMPGSFWTMLHPGARLSAQDVATICDAAGQAQVGLRP